MYHDIFLEIMLNVSEQLSYLLLSPHKSVFKTVSRSPKRCSIARRGAVGGRERASLFWVAARSRSVEAGAEGRAGGEEPASPSRRGQNWAAISREPGERERDEAVRRSKRRAVERNAAENSNKHPDAQHAVCVRVGYNGRKTLEMTALVLCERR